MACPRARSTMPTVAVITALALAPFVGACAAPPETFVVVDNGYAPSPAGALVVYSAYWQAASFPDPIPPGASSASQDTVPASASTAYVLLAPGWDPASSMPPASFVVLESRSGFGVELGDTLRIPVDDATFLGNCASGSVLPQSRADFITQLVFPGILAGPYDAATCTTTSGPG
jgi:hypothetical protein